MKILSPSSANTPSSAFEAQDSLRAFGSLLKTWRVARRYSQLELALEANVSQRHLSFLESGRAQPSREMVLQLARALRIPLRQRNELLVASGFAPVFAERTLDNEEMRAIREALEATLRHHAPYPALAVDRHWNVVLQNEAFGRLVALLGEPEHVWGTVDPSGRKNLLRLTMHPLGLQPMIRNWEQSATLVLTRLKRETEANPADTELLALHSALASFPGVPLVPASPISASSPPVLSLELALGDGLSLRLFSMVATFGTAVDVTADELRLELFFPQDEFTARFLRG